MSGLRGRLLVAAPSLSDPNFRRTIVLVCDDGPLGALGVVLNRPSALPVAEVVPDIAHAVGARAVVWAGGPVRSDGVVVLAEWEEPREATSLVLGAIGLLGTGAGDDALERAGRARVYAGWSGWAPGQLDAELSREDWIVVDAEPADVFTDDAERLWAAVLIRQGGRLALLARMPDDPSVN